jgi:glucose/arabinose dehydrogenase
MTSLLYSHFVTGADRIPMINRLWGVENSGDSFVRTVNGVSIDIHDDNPSEELDYLGDVTVPNNNWYGYPACFTVWHPASIPDRIFNVGDQFVLAPNATFVEAACDHRSVAPRLNFQAHLAPIGSKFDASNQNLYVILHGSWNRPISTGYKLVVVPFQRQTSGEHTPVAGAHVTNGYQPIFYAPNEASCSASTCARTVGLVFDNQQRLYMTSDASGEVFLLQKS